MYLAELLGFQLPFYAASCVGFSLWSASPSYRLVFVLSSPACSLVGRDIHTAEKKSQWCIHIFFFSETDPQWLLSVGFLVSICSLCKNILIVHLFPVFAYLWVFCHLHSGRGA